ncbi:MAG TPA: TauD/TfdA family dioxygenase, partial [Reyranella sp.]|nr:TauD/TfdA family dioxygenase [Reyranella sp.]
HIEVRPLAGALGAEVAGVDMARDLDDEVVHEVRQAFLDHLVIFLRDQKVTPQQQVAFARRFGEPMAYPQLKGLAEAPLITPVVKLEHERNNFGGIWHSDTTYLPEPPMGSMLLALEVPPYGGDTLFANQYLAYEQLSEGLRKTLDGLVGISSSAKAEVSKTREDQMKKAGAQLQVLTGEHPIVRTHPETGRKALYLTTGQAARIAGMSDDESRLVLELLQGKCAQPDLVYRHRWRPGDLVMWDNRCTQHYAVHDYGEHERLLHRTTVTGERPV